MIHFFFCYSAVPQASEFLDAPLTKKEKGKNKKKDLTKKEQVSDITGFTAGSVPILGADTHVSRQSPAPIPAGVSGAVIAGEPTAPTPMRSGFTRIGGVGGDSAPTSGSATPAPAEDRSKVQFGFVPVGGKRKALDEPSGSAAPKRR